MSQPNINWGPAIICLVALNAILLLVLSNCEIHVKFAEPQRTEQKP